MPEIVSPTEALATVTRGLVARKATIQQLLPAGVDAGRFLSLARDAIRTTPALLECEPLSVIGSVIDVSKLGLSLDRTLGQAYLVPFYDKELGRKRATFIPGYRGLMNLAYRSSSVSSIWAGVVRKGDIFVAKLGTNPYLEHELVPLDQQKETYNDDKSILGFYACADVGAREPVFAVMSLNEVKDIQARSKSGRSGPWVTDFAEMGRKTVVRKLCKYLPLTTDAQSVVGRDELIDAGVNPPPTEVELENVGETVPDTPTDLAKALDNTEAT